MKGWSTWENGVVWILRRSFCCGLMLRSLCHENSQFMTQMLPLPYNILVNSTTIWEMLTGLLRNIQYGIYMLLEIER